MIKFSRVVVAMLDCHDCANNFGLHCERLYREDERIEETATPEFLFSGQCFDSYFLLLPTKATEIYGDVAQG